MKIKDGVELVGSLTLASGLIGFLIGRREVHDMAAQCDQLIEANKAMQDKCENLQMVNDNLWRANQWRTELMLKEAIIEDYDDAKDAVEAWAEESKQIVDEMSDEEYEETLAYIRSKKHD